MKVEKTLKYLSSPCGNVAFMPETIFPLSACLFVFGSGGLAELPNFIKKSKKILKDYDLKVWEKELTEGNNGDLVKVGYSLCVGIENKWDSHCIYVHDRADAESVLLHEIIHLVDFVIQASNISNDTEVRAYLFNHYEQTIKSVRK